MRALILYLGLVLTGVPASAAEVPIDALPRASDLTQAYPAEAPGVGRPRPELTPGAVRSSDPRVICPVGTDALRTVSTAEKRRIARRYGLTNRAGYTMDHLLPLGLGGADVPANIWPESHAGALRKDRCERRTRRLVCSGRLAIGEAQRGFLTDYVAFCASVGAPVE